MTNETSLISQNQKETQQADQKPKFALEQKYKASNKIHGICHGTRNGFEQNFLNKIIPKYSLTEGLNEKIYRKLIEQVLKNIPELNEWHSIEILKKLNKKKFF